MRMIPLLLALWSTACASKSPLAGGERPSHPPLELRLMPDRYVELVGERMTFEAFVYRARLACRKADETKAPRPWLNVTAPRDGSAELGSLLNEVRDAAYDAGIQHIELTIR